MKSIFRRGIVFAEQHLKERSDTLPTEGARLGKARNRNRNRNRSRSKVVVEETKVDYEAQTVGTAAALWYGLFQVLVPVPVPVCLVSSCSHG